MELKSIELDWRGRLGESRPMLMSETTLAARRRFKVVEDRPRAEIGVACRCDDGDGGGLKGDGGTLNEDGGALKGERERRIY